MAKHHEPKQSKAKPIDLGALQDAYLSSKKVMTSDGKALLKAQEAFDRSKKTFTEVSESLRAASKAVLD